MRHLARIGLCAALACGACDKPKKETPAAHTSKATKEAKATVPAPPAKPEAPPSDDGKQAMSDEADPPVRADGTIFADAELMGTRVSINVFVPSGKTPRFVGQVMQAALRSMADVEEAMSEWRPTSELSKLSAKAGTGPVPVSSGLLTVLSRAKAIAADTDGAFDPTFHGVGQLWSFADGAKPPSKDAIAEKLPLVGHRGLVVDLEARTVALDTPGMMLGLGAIAKGYAVDRASALLKAKGLGNHVVEAGGDTYAAGTKNGVPWAVGIQRPGAKGMVGMLPTQDRAVVTSGDYQRYFEHEGKRYAHILDPKTGWPVPADRSPRSVTLVAGNATDADAYATAVAVLGAKAGMKLVEARPDLEAVIVGAADAVHISSGLKDTLVTRPASDADARSRIGSSPPK